MNPTSTAFLGYLLLMLALIIVITTYRSVLTLSGKHAANNFKTTGDDISEFSARLCRAHANCYENFPLFGGILLFALASGQTAITDGLALTLLGARVLQSLTHIISTSVVAVFARFGFYLVQLVIIALWLYKFLS